MRFDKKSIFGDLGLKNCVQKSPKWQQIASSGHTDTVFLPFDSVLEKKNFDVISRCLDNQIQYYNFNLNRVIFVIMQQFNNKIGTYILFKLELMAPCKNIIV